MIIEAFSRDSLAVNINPVCRMETVSPGSGLKLLQGVLCFGEFKLKSGINRAPYGLPPFIPF
jgi:hypothetical protein